MNTKLCAPKVAKVLTLGILGLPFGSFETKRHLGASLMLMHRLYYKGEGVGFPQIRAVVSVVSLSLLVDHFNAKSVPAMH